VSRRVVLILLALLALPALALAAETDPKERLTAADQAKARSIVLKRTDFVAGWKRLPATKEESDLSCSFYNPDGSDLTLSGKANAEFERPGGVPSVLSYADVYASAKDAAAAWNRTVRPALARCLAQFFKKEAETDPNTKVTILKQGRIAFPRVAPRTMAFRVAMQLKVTEAGKTSTVPVTIHLVVVGRGRAEAGLLTFAPAPGIPGPDLRAFAKLLAERMQKAGF